MSAEVVRRWYFIHSQKESPSNLVNPNLDNKGSQSRKENKSIEIRIRKCRCNSTWCPECFKMRGSRKVADRIRAMNWRSIRHVVLTIDRKLFNSGKEAYEYVSKEKLINRMLRNLKRSHGIDYRDYIYILEFHKDGFPHWHLLVERYVQGKDAMIGGDLLRKYWTVGSVSEGYVKSEKHYKELSGYYEKNGYFDGKEGHQGTLPEWALKYEKSIRRYDGKRKDTGEEKPEMTKGEKMEKEMKAKEKEVKGINRVRTTYEIIINKCGSQTQIEMVAMGGMAGFGMMVDYEYRKMKKLLRGAVYEEGIGVVADVDYNDIRKICSEIKDERLIQNVVMLDAFIRENQIII